MPHSFGPRLAILLGFRERMTPILFKTKTLFTIALALLLSTQTACWFNSGKSKETSPPKGNGGGYTGVIHSLPIARPQKAIAKNTIQTSKAEVITAKKEFDYVSAETGKTISKESSKLQKLKWDTSKTDIADLEEAPLKEDEDEKEEEITSLKEVDVSSPLSATGIFESTSEESVEFPIDYPEEIVSSNPSKEAALTQPIWTQTSTIGAPTGRILHSAFWTGNQMLVYGGQNSSSNFLNTGGLFDPISNSWKAISVKNAPPGRSYTSIVWTGNSMIVFGGQLSRPLNTGASYDLAKDSWTTLPTKGAPLPCLQHSAVWTGNQMIIYGGMRESLNESNTTYAFDPSSGAWEQLPNLTLISARYAHTAVWSGNEMIVFGGNTRSGYAEGAAKYSVENRTWKAISNFNIPEPRNWHSALWTGNKMMIYGGISQSRPINSGGLYDPRTDTWISTPLTGAPTPRHGQTMAANSTDVLLYGGSKNVQDAEFYIRAYSYSYSLAQNEWRALASPHFDWTHRAASTVWSGNQFLIFGGQIPSTKDSTALYPTNSGLIFQP